MDNYVRLREYARLQLKTYTDAYLCKKNPLETSQKHIAIMLQSIFKWTLLYFVKNGMDGGNPTVYSSYRLNVKDFTNKGIARKCVDQTKHDWRAINSHYIVDKFGCKHTLYSSTTAEGLKCS